MKKFTVHRPTWHRGKGANGSRLFVPATEQMCCLGHVASRCGYHPSELQHCTMPAGLIRLGGCGAGRWLDGTGVNADDKALILMAEVNDAPGTPDDERERILIAQAKTLGWELTFTD